MPSSHVVAGLKRKTGIVEFGGQSRPRSRACRVRRSPVGWSRPEISDRRVGVLIICTVLLFFPSLAAAAKVDVIHLTNGDRITGEIKRLD